MSPHQHSRGPRGAGRCRQGCRAGTLGGGRRGSHGAGGGQSRSPTGGGSRPAAPKPRPTRWAGRPGAAPGPDEAQRGPDGAARPAPLHQSRRAAGRPRRRSLPPPVSQRLKTRPAPRVAPQPVGIPSAAGPERRLLVRGPWSLHPPLAHLQLMVPGRARPRGEEEPREATAGAQRPEPAPFKRRRAACWAAPRHAPPAALLGAGARRPLAAAPPAPPSGRGRARRGDRGSCRTPRPAPTRAAAGPLVERGGAAASAVGEAGRPGRAVSALLSALLQPPLLRLLLSFPPGGSSGQLLGRVRPVATSRLAWPCLPCRGRVQFLLRQPPRPPALPRQERSPHRPRRGSASVLPRLSPVAQARCSWLRTAAVPAAGAVEGSVAFQLGATWCKSLLVSNYP